ncbi:hypothetical protein N7475_000266 [Penicillium sp. IBT 31633x]|nr:hypothetical protein N7475_000266 [Penicillium sp. IBT 31633x]
MIPTIAQSTDCNPPPLASAPVNSLSTLSTRFPPCQLAFHPGGSLSTLAARFPFYRPLSTLATHFPPWRPAFHPTSTRFPPCRLAYSPARSMAAMEVLLPVRGSHKRWTSGYEEIDDLTLRQLLMEAKFALRSIEFELSVREIEPSPRSTTTKSTSENTLVKPPYLKSQKAKETIIRREDELSVIYGKIQNTADKIKQNGLSDFAVVPVSERAQLFIKTLRNIMETKVNAAIPSHDNWTSDTHSAMLWMILKCAGPAHMLLVLHSFSQRQFRKLGVHAAAKIVQHVVQN